jgi:hypothetical protein
MFLFFSIQYILVYVLARTLINSRYVFRQIILPSSGVFLKQEGKLQEAYVIQQVSRGRCN